MAVFGVFELPALLVLCFGAIRVTYGQVTLMAPKYKSSKGDLKTSTVML